MIVIRVEKTSAKPELPFACTERLYRFCGNIRKAILKRDSQILGLFWGKGGSGKSLLAIKTMHLVSGDTLNLSKIAFNKGDYITAILTSRKESVSGDEGISLFHAKEAMHRDGIIMQQLLDQMRQKNLYSPINMVDILDTNSILLERLNFACHVWESKILIKDKDGEAVRDDEGELQYKTIKGNYALYPRLQSHDYLTPMLAWLHLRKAAKKNPMIKVPRPPPAYDRSGGQEYSEEGNHGFYPPGIPEIEYRKKKEAILDKYKKSLERKPRNTQIDYFTMDKLIRAKIKQTEIAKHLNVAIQTVRIRAALIKSNHKKSKSKTHNRGKRKH